MARGKFITFEGGEGCGKSTQVKRLKEALEKTGELLLFLAARAQLVKNVIRPALEAGKWVVSDRFSDSTIAYQGYGRGLPLDILKDMNNFACEGLKPDLTLLLDVTPETSHARMHQREEATNTTSDRIELAGDEFHRRLRRGFAELAKVCPERIVTIDANGIKAMLCSGI